MRYRELSVGPRHVVVVVVVEVVRERRIASERPNEKERRVTPLRNRGISDSSDKYERRVQCREQEGRTSAEKERRTEVKAT